MLWEINRSYISSSTSITGSTNGDFSENGKGLTVGEGLVATLLGEVLQDCGKVQLIDVGIATTENPNKFAYEWAEKKQILDSRRRIVQGSFSAFSYNFVL